MLEIDICPGWLLSWLRVPAEWRRDAGVWLSSLLALAAPFALIHVPHVCLMRAVLHLPCPGCGVMHALQNLLELKPGAAWRANPGGVALGAALLLQVGLRPLPMRNPDLRSAVDGITRYAGVVATGCLGTVWIERLFSGGW